MRFHTKAGICLAGISILLWIYWPRLRPLSTQVSDFSAFWVAGKQAGAGDLYDKSANMAFEDRLNPARFYRFNLRMPWQTLLVKPFTILPYGIAVWAWQAAMAIAVVLFVCTLPFDRRWPAAIALSWSVPLANSFAEAQDDPLVLLAFGAAMWAWREKKRSWAGAALALCGLKIHLILPALLVALIRWELAMLAAFTAASAALAGASFLIQRDWLTGMTKILSEAWFWNPAAMTNLYALSYRHPAIEIVGGILVLACCSIAALKLEGELAFSVAVAAGILVSRHAFSQDLMLVYPLGLLLLQRSGIAPRIAAGLILSPIPAFLYLDHLSTLAGQVCAGMLALVVAFCASLAWARSNEPGNKTLQASV